MKSLNEMKKAARNSNQTEAKMVLVLINSLEEEGADDDLMMSSLDELIEWVQSFRNSFGVIK